MHPSVRSALLYLAWAVVLVSALTLIGSLAPHIPPFALPFVFLLYAIPATLGSMYNVVVSRHHRQGKLNSKGKLSHYNRRWFFWFLGFFVFYLFSGMLFVLQAPSWDLLEWVLVWVAIAVYYGVFLLAQCVSKREYRPRFYKASAIRWSIVVTAILLCLAYALLPDQGQSAGQIDIRQAIQGRVMPFADSPSALLSELDKLTTYPDYLIRYGLNQIAGGSIVVAFVIKFALSVSVFFGITSQLGCCLLSLDEIKSEFKLLPVDDSDGSERQVTRRYALLLLGTWLVLSGAFLWAEAKVEEARTTDEYADINKWLDDVTEAVVLATELGIDKVNDYAESGAMMEEFNTEFVPRRDAYIYESEQRISELLEAYYADCEDNVGSYAEWYEGIAGSFARLVKPLAYGMAEAAFDERVVGPVSRSELDDVVSEYIDGLKLLYEERLEAEGAYGLGTSAVMLTADDIAAGIPQPLALWPSWDSNAGKAFVDDDLLYSGEGASGEEVEQRVSAFIASQRDKALVELKQISKRFFIDHGA